MASILKIYSDKECLIYKDMEQVGSISLNIPLKIELAKGIYNLIFEDISDSAKRIEIDYKMEDDVEDLIRVNLTSNKISCENILRRLDISYDDLLKRYIRRIATQYGGDVKLSFSILEPETNFEIPLKFDYVEHFQGNLAKVSLNGNYGYIDKTGKIITPIIYNQIYDFHEALALVHTTSYGFIDEMGYEIIPPKFHNARSFENGTACVQEQLNGFWGCIDKTGKVVIPFIYSKISNFRNLWIVMKDGLYGLIDIENKTILPIIYDEIKGSTARIDEESFDLNELLESSGY